MLGHSPCKAVSYKELNAAVYDEQYGQNTDRLRQLASELRRRLAALGLTPTNEYLPQGSRLGYVLMVSVEERLHSPSAERAAVETLRPEARWARSTAPERLRAGVSVSRTRCVP